MKENLFKFLFISLLFSLVACSNPASGNSGNKGNDNNKDDDNKELPATPEEPAPEYIRFSITKAVDEPEDLETLDSFDAYWENQDNLMDNLVFGCYKKSYTQIRSFLVDSELNFDDYSLDGNSSSETELLQWTNSHGYSYVVLFIAEDEKSDKVTVTVEKPGKDLSKSVDFYICSKKFSAQDAADMVSKETVFFESPVYIDKEGFKNMNQAVSDNSGHTFNFDFSNCFFALNEVPRGAFCSPKQQPNSFGESEIQKVEEWGFGNVGNVTLPAVLYKIQTGAFYGCYNLTTQFPQTLKSIDFHAFAGCKKVDNSTLLPEVSVFGQSFAGAEEITEATLNNKYADINAYSFCENLQTIRIGKDVETIRTDVYPMYGNFVVDEENTKYKSVNGVLYSKDGTVLYKVTNTNCGVSFFIPSSVTEIASYAFASCKNLYEIYIPSSVTKISYSAIDNNQNLKSIYIDLAEEPSGWETGWVSGAYNREDFSFVEPELHWTGTENPGEGETGTLSGTYKVSGNERCTLKFSGNAVERFDNGRSIETYTYTLTGENFVLTSDRPESKDYPGEFEIVFTENGFVLNKKNDAALSWIGLWTKGQSMETVEFVR